MRALDATPTGRGSLAEPVDTIIVLPEGLA
jgi:hypothetical protein